MRIYKENTLVCMCTNVLVARTAGHTQKSVSAPKLTNAHKTQNTSCPHEPTLEEEEVMRADDPQGDADARYDRQDTCVCVL